MPIMQKNVGDDSKELLRTAQELADRVADNADRIDFERQIPAELAGEIADRGFFRLLVPRSLGGAELGFLEFLKIVQTFAHVDGSTAWCINQNNVFATASVIMPEQIAHEVWGDRRAVVANGPPTSSVVAIPADGGYRLSGTWDFSTGSRHATWLAALAPVKPSNQGQGPHTDKVASRVMLFPKAQANFVDDSWRVNGLRGTGSFSFQVNDLFVPGTRTYDPTDIPREQGPLYIIPRTLLFASGDATIALGIARSSLNTAVDIARKKNPLMTSTLLQEQSTAQRLIGEGEAIWQSAHAFLEKSASSIWHSACENHAVSTEERIQLRLASSYAIRKAAEVIDITYNLCGSSAIFASNPIQRQFQDVRVITQHIQGRLTNYDTAGQFYLGLEPEGSF